jgi:hypothetical protein
MIENDLIGDPMTKHTDAFPELDRVLKFHPLGIS